MRKVLVGFVAVGVILGLRPLLRRGGQKMSEHCAQMASKCRETTATQGTGGTATELHGWCRDAPRFTTRRSSSKEAAMEPHANR